MDQETFDHIVYEMWYPPYPNPNRRDAVRAKFSEIDPEVRHAGLLRILQSDQDGMIWRAIYLLLTEDHDRFLPFVLPLFESRNPAVRLATATIFGSGRFPSALEPLEKLARNDEDAKVRCAAIEALGKCGSADTIEVLREFFDSTDDDGNGWPLSKTAVKAVDSIQKR